MPQGWPAAPSVQTVTDKLATISPTKGNVAGYYVWLVEPDAADESLGAQTTAPGAGVYGPSSVTDAQGNWSIPNVPASKYVTFFGARPERWEHRGKSPYLVALNPASGAYGDKTSIIVAPTSVNLQSEGADMTGAVVSDTAWTKAKADLPSGGGQIYVPPGTAKMSTQKNETGKLFLKGAGKNISTVLFGTALGSGIPAIIANGPTNDADIIFEDIAIKGPGPSITLGTKTATCDGIQCLNPVIFNRVNVWRFDAGVISSSANGHIRAHDLNCTENYYGLFTGAGGDNGDCYYEQSAFNSNAFAGIACPSPGTMDRPMFVRCHLGFQPYAVYQEAGSGGGFWLNAPQFEHPVFEAIGNGVFFTENVGNSRSFVHGMKLDQLYHSWNATYKIAARVKDYAMVLGHIDGTWRYDPQLGSNPLTAGTINVWSIGSNSGATFFGNPAYLAPTDFASGWAVGGWQPTLYAQSGSALSLIQEFPAYGAWASFPLQYSRIILAMSAFSSGAGTTFNYPKGFATTNRFAKVVDTTGIAVTVGQNGFTWGAGLGPATGLIVVEGF